MSSPENLIDAKHDAKEILDALVTGDPWPPKLSMLFKSVNETLLADGRTALRESDVKKRFRAFSDYALNQPRLWERFLEQKYPEPFKRLSDRLCALTKERDSIEAKFMNTDQDGDINLHKPQLAYDRTSDEYKQKYQKWFKDPKNSVLNDRLYEILEALNQGVGSRPKLVKGLFEQCVSTKSFINKHKRQYSDKPRGVWEPFGLSNMSKGANYVYLEKQGDMTVLLREGKPERILALHDEDLQEALQRQKIPEAALGEMEMGKTKIYIKAQNGKISGMKIETRGIKRSSSDISLPYRGR